MMKAIDEKCDVNIEEVDKFVVSTNSRVYRLEKYLGKGGYGEVYECVSEDSKKIYALKKENILRTRIPKEIEVLKRASRHDCKQICKYIDDGRQEDYVFVVMTLLGKDLSKLRRERKTKNFSLNTSLRIGLLTLSAIRELHEIFVISRDIKPSNFALGINEECKNIYIFDFGLSRFYKNQDGSVLPANPHPVFCGTTRYASLRAHQKLELGRRDDLESWLYVMVELSSGTLPWRTLSKMKKKKQLKEQVHGAKLRIRLGDERKKFFENSLPILDYILVMIDGLTLEADPPYEQIQYMFEKLMVEMGVKWDDIYDWEEAEKIQSSQLVSMNGVISTTSTAMATYSRCRSTERVAMTTTASTESSSSLPYIQVE